MKRILSIIVALLAIAGSATAQSLTAQDLEAKVGEKATLTVSINGATDMTALQFNLDLPEGVTLADDAPTLGESASGHTLTVETLTSGDHLFVLYSMDMNTLKDGELLRIPVTVGNEAQTGEGRLYTVRSSTTESVSYVSENASFTVTVTEGQEEISGDVNGDGQVGIADIVAVTNVMASITTDADVKARADVNGDGQVGIADIVAITNIMAGK